MGPLKGHHNNNNNRRRRKRTNEDEEMESDFSEQGYSPSEDELIDDNPGRNKLRKKKSRSRGNGFTKPTGYVTLDDPTSHASYV